MTKENFFPPTTFEMDGLLTQEDIDNRFFIMALCLGCRDWAKYDTRERYTCPTCNHKEYDRRESRSIRTWHKDLTTKKKRGKMSA